MTTFYSTAAAVRTATGIGPEDLGFDSDVTLNAFIEELLLEATDLMDRTMRLSFLTAAVIPPGLNGIARDAVSDAVRVMVQTRQTSVVRIDDFAVRTITAVTLSKDVRERLTLFGAGGGVSSIEMGEDQLAPLPDFVDAASLTSDTPY